MKRWTNGLPGATKRLGAMMALRGLSLSQPRMRADTHDGPEQIAPLQRPDTLMQLSRSLSWKSILYRTAGPYILALSGLSEASSRLSAFGVKRTCRDRGRHIRRPSLTHSGHRPDRNPAVQQTFAGRAPSLGTAGGSLYGRPSD
jgi:hypothetical protein